MMEIKYDLFYFSVMSLSAIVLLCTILGPISPIYMKYAALGLIECVAAWVVDGQIVHNAGENKRHWKNYRSWILLILIVALFVSFLVV